MLEWSGKRMNQMLEVDLTGCVVKSMEGMSAKYSVHAVRKWAATVRKTAMSCTRIKDLSLGTPQLKRKEREGELTGGDLGVRAWKKEKRARKEESRLHILEEQIGSQQTEIGLQIGIVQKNQRRKRKMKENTWRHWRKPSRSKRRLKKEKEQEVLEESERQSSLQKTEERNSTGIKKENGQEKEAQEIPEEASEGQDRVEE